jgi:CRP-like cAMP-binding protein
MNKASELAHFKEKIEEVLSFDININDELLRLASIVNLAQGQILFTQGELAQNCFLVLSGSLRISLQLNSSESTVAILSRGEFGGVLLMGNNSTCYPGSVIALTQSCVLLIPKETYIAAWSKNPKALSIINNCIHKRMQHLQEDKALQQLDVKSRLIAFLYRHYLEKKDLISKKITRKDISLSIGAKTETVIRELKKLEREGLVKTNKSVICISDSSYFIRAMNHERRN